MLVPGLGGHAVFVNAYFSGTYGMWGVSCTTLARHRIYVCDVRDVRMYTTGLKC